MATKELVPQLDVILAAKRQYLSERRATTPIEAVRALASMQKRPQPILSSIPHQAPILIIGQVKYHAPERRIQTSSYDPVSLAMRHIHAGADAIALYTDETLYQGGLDDLVLVSRAINSPVISQDFILDEYQIVESRAAGASGLVLYAELLPQATLRALVSATQRNRMTAIVEVNNHEELDYALSLSPYVIGLSRHDLRTDEIRPAPLEEMRARIPSSIRVMITDALHTLDDVQMAANLHVDAVVLAEELLQSESRMQQVEPLLRRDGTIFEGDL
jgi:indole-3-glycerol phosphate synthase